MSILHLFNYLHGILYFLTSFLQNTGLPAILPWGKWWCPLLPKSNVDIHIVVGTSIKLPKIISPTRNEGELCVFRKMLFSSLP